MSRSAKSDRFNRERFKIEFGNLPRCVIVYVWIHLRLRCQACMLKAWIDYFNLKVKYINRCVEQLMVFIGHSQSKLVKPNLIWVICLDFNCLSEAIEA